MARNQKIARLLAMTRDSFAARRLVESILSVTVVLENRDAVSPAERVDLLERSCVYGPIDLVRLVYRELGPFTYRGWALALALRTAREDVARFLLDQGVDLLEDVDVPELYRAIAAHESSLSRFDLTRSSPNLFLNPEDHTVCTEVFASFTGNDQLMGSSFSTSTDLAATCDLVGRLAEEGKFDSVVFDDLFRAAVVRMGEVMREPARHEPYATEALGGLARKMLELHRQRGLGSDYLFMMLGNLIKPRVQEQFIAFICDLAPQVFLGRLQSLRWLEDEPDLVRHMVPHLCAGTEEQNGALLCLLARNGSYEELRMLADWPRTMTRQNLDAAVEAASAAGHAETATLLLARRRALDETPDPGAARACGPEGAQGAGACPDDLGGLAGLLL
jgi:hypothetical protein